MFEKKFKRVEEFDVISPSSISSIGIFSKGNFEGIFDYFFGFCLVTFRGV
jgi:hypothetical protein